MTVGLILLCAAHLVIASVPPPAPRISIAPGVDLPMVVLGTGSGQKGDVVNATALWLGGTSGVGIDTAYVYNDEAAIAKGIAAVQKPREDILIETKIPCTSYKDAVANIADNLKQLGVKQVDMTLIHSPSCGVMGSIKETWQALEEAQNAGLTKTIGVSNFNIQQLEDLAAYSTIAPVLNQCELSVSYHDDATIEYCAEKGIVYQAYSPLCGGFNGSSCTSRGGKNVLSVVQVQQIAAARRVSAAQVGLKWIVQQGIPLATAIWVLDYMNEDLDLWSWGDLTDAEMSELSAVASSPGM